MAHRTKGGRGRRRAQAGPRPRCEGGGWGVQRPPTSLTHAHTHQLRSKTCVSERALIGDSQVGTRGGEPLRHTARWHAEISQGGLR